MTNKETTMADRVDAAIAALKVALKEAEKSGDLWWKPRRATVGLVSFLVLGGAAGAV
jgi:hypothetical protein